VAVPALSSADWDVAARGAEPLLAGFWAEWCLPSHALAGALEAAAARHAGRLRVGLVDAERERALAERCGIRGLPTVVLLRDGREVLRRVGLMTGSELLGLLEATLGPRL
jgi:thioredoxin 2